MLPRDLSTASELIRASGTVQKGFIVVDRIHAVLVSAEKNLMSQGSSWKSH